MTQPQAPKHTALLPVRVRPLAWYTPTDHPHDDEDAKLMAHGIGGRYSISEQTSLHIGGMGHLLWWADDQFTFAEFRTVEDAKTAAQADYEARIISAIEPDPSSSAQEEMRRARDEAQAACTAWQEVYKGLEAHLLDRIEQRDPANPQAYLDILRGYVAFIDRSSQQIVASRWHDYSSHRQQIERLEAAQEKGTAALERLRADIADDVRYLSDIKRTEYGDGSLDAKKGILTEIDKAFASAPPTSKGDRT